MQHTLFWVCIMLLSRNVYTWAPNHCSRIILTGNKRTLTYDDIPDIMEKDKCHSVHALFQSSWKRRSQKLPPLDNTNGDLSNISAVPMLMALINASWWPFVASGILRLIFSFQDFLNPVLLQWDSRLIGRVHVISMVSCQKGPTRHAYAWQVGGPFGRIPSVCASCMGEFGPPLNNSLPPGLYVFM